MKAIIFVCIVFFVFVFVVKGIWEQCAQCSRLPQNQLIFRFNTCEYAIFMVLGKFWGKYKVHPLVYKSHICSKCEWNQCVVVHFVMHRRDLYHPCGILFCEICRNALCNSLYNCGFTKSLLSFTQRMMRLTLLTMSFVFSRQWLNGQRFWIVGFLSKFGNLSSDDFFIMRKFIRSISISPKDIFLHNFTMKQIGKFIH